MSGPKGFGVGSSRKEADLALIEIMARLGPRVHDAAIDALHNMENSGGFFMPDVYEFVVRLNYATRD